MENISDVFFETERLYAREFEPTDVDAVFAYAGNVENTGFLPFSPEPYDQVEDFVKHTISDRLQDPRRDFDLAICLKESGVMIGAVGLFLSDDMRQAELGYVLDMRYWHNGYAREAARGMMRFGFLGLDLHRIWAKCDDKNTASLRVMESIGMRREGHFIKSEYTSVYGKKGWRSKYLCAILQKEYLLKLPDGDHSPTES